MGGYEPNPKPWAVDGLPSHFEFQLLDDDLEHFEPLLELAIGRVPAMESAGIKQFINGPESFTPDGEFHSRRGARGARHLCRHRLQRLRHRGRGRSRYGTRRVGGQGRTTLRSLAGRYSPVRKESVSIPSWVRTRTLEAYGKHYTMAWPYEEYRSGRPLRRSPLYDRLAAQGACFGEKLGWERPNWFADVAKGEKPEDHYSYERQNWFDAVGREHEAARERVAVFDQTSFAKFLLVGRDAESALSWICANDVAKPPGSPRLHADAE